MKDLILNVLFYFLSFTYSRAILWGSAIGLAGFPLSKAVHRQPIERHHAQG